MTAVSALPIELLHEILRLACGRSDSSDPLRKEYLWVDSKRTRERHDRASDRGMATARLISQVCRSWRALALPLSYQEVRLMWTSRYTLKELLVARKSSPNLFNETRRLVGEIDWAHMMDDVARILQSMRRLEWLEITSHEIDQTRWLPLFLEGRSTLLYLDLHSFTGSSHPLPIELKGVSLIASAAPRLRRLSCAIKYSDTHTIQAPSFPCLQVLRLFEIECEPDAMQEANEWFGKWHLPALRQVYIPVHWDSYLGLLLQGVGAHLKVFELAKPHIPSTYLSQPLWPLCPHVDTLITPHKQLPLSLLRDTRPRHYVFAYPFGISKSESDIGFLNRIYSALRIHHRVSAASGAANPHLSVQFTEIMWQSWIDNSTSPSLPVHLRAQIRSVIERWKSTARQLDIRVSDGDGVDLRSVSFPSEAPKPRAKANRSNKGPVNASEH